MNIELLNKCKVIKWIWNYWMNIVTEWTENYWISIKFLNENRIISIKSNKLNKININFEYK